MNHQVCRWIRRSSILFLAIAQLTACSVTAPVKEQSIEEETFSVRRPASIVTPSDLRTMQRMQQRLIDVAAPLLIKNTVACKQNVRNLLGFTAKNRYSYSDSLSKMAATTLGLGEALQITGVMPGSGAQRIRLRRGDKLIAVGKQAMPQGKDAEYRAPAILAPQVLGKSKLKLTIQRKRAPFQVSLPLTRACGFRVELGNSDDVNLYVDGRRIMVTRGMMQFVRSDRELAYVIAKGMAHNIFQHPQQLKMTKAASHLINDLQQAMPDDPQGGASRLVPLPAEMDVVADRLSLYMASRAGYRIGDAANFWQRLARWQPAGSFTLLHPATDARIEAMEKTIYEIRLTRLRRR